MLFNDFSGGVNTRINPRLLPSNNSQILINADIRDGTLQPVKDKTFSQPSNPFFTWYYATNTLVSSTAETTWVEYRSDLYSSDGTKIADGVANLSIGIDKPLIAPTVTDGVLAPKYDYAYAYESTAGVAPFLKTRLSPILENVFLGSTIKVPHSDFEDFSIKLYRREAGDTSSSDFVLLKVFLDGNVNHYYLDENQDYSASAEVYSYTGVAYEDPTTLLGLQEKELLEYTYVYTYYDSLRDVESQPSDISVTSSSTALGATINVVASLNTSAVNKIRIYRSGTGLTSFTLVDTIANGTTSYVDTRANMAIGGSHILDSFNNNPIPANIKYISSINAMLFAVKDNKLHYSEIGKPDYWSVFNFLTFDEDLTGYGAVPNGILVFTRFKTYIVTGTSPATFSYYLLDSEQGCISHESIRYVNGSLLWLSLDGICSSNGGNTIVISRASIGKFTVSSVYNAVIFDGTYYLSYVANGIGNILAVDFEYGRIFRYLRLGVNRLGVFNDKLYGYSNNGIHELFTHSSTLEMTYKSPRYARGSVLKTIKDVFISSGGAYNIKVYADGNIINDVNVTSTNYNLKLSKIVTHSLEFEIKSRTPMYEIEAKMIGRQ